LVSLIKSGVLTNATQITLIIKQAMTTKDGKDAVGNMPSSPLIPRQDSASVAGYHGAF